ncbi:MAG: 4Fe-4S binding protein [Clostridiales bacterium]
MEMKWPKNFRLIILALILISVTIASYMHQKLGGGKAPSIHALCPYGTLESLLSIVKDGNLLRKIYSGTVLMFIVTIVITILFRRSFCGNICPFGALQEFVGKIGRKIFKKKFIISSKPDYYLRYIKYIVLVVTLFMAWKLKELWMSPFDPWAAYAHIFAGFEELKEEFLIGSILLIITIVGSLLVDRFFCKYLCPLGAFYAILGKLSPFRVSRNSEICTNCTLCSKECPMNIEVHKMDDVKTAECINCQRCVTVCNKDGSIFERFGTKKIKPLFSLLIVVAIFFGSVFIAQAMGIYKDTPEIKADLENLSYGEVRGYMTIEESANATNTDLNKFYEVYKIPSDTPKDSVMNTLENYHELKEKFEEEEAKKSNEDKDGKDDNDKKTDIDGEDIKGWMSIEEAADVAGVSLDKFYELFEIPKEIPANSVMRELDNIIPNYDFHKLKDNF